MTITIIIPTFNRPDLLRATLASTTTQTLPAGEFDILVVDNAGTEATKTLADEFDEKSAISVRYVFEPQTGLHYGRHRGARETDAEILVYVDDDIEAPPGWLEKLIAPFADTSVAMVGGKVLPKWQSAAPDFFDEKLKGSLSLLDFGDKPLDMPRSSGGPFGCNMAIRKSVLIESGGFHPDGMADKKRIWYRGDGETGLFHKLVESGHTVRYEPEAWLYHVIPASRCTPEYFLQRKRNQGISDSYSITRNAPSRLLMPGRVVLRMLRALSMWRHSQGDSPESFRYRLDAWYSRGFAMHQLRMLISPSLYEHVIRKDYYLADSDRPTAKGRVVIVFPFAFFDSVPSMTNAANLLAEAGFQVDIQLEKNDTFVTPVFDHPNIKVIAHSPVDALKTLANRESPLHRMFAKQQALYNIVLFLGRHVGRLTNRLIALTKDAYKSFVRERDSKPLCLIAVDAKGLREAWKSNVLRVPVFYYSLELLLSDELNDEGLIELKQQEKSLLKKTDAVIIQDPARGRLLAEDNDYPMSKMIFVPNAPLGPLRKDKSRYWHHAFSIPDDKKIALYSGALASWTRIEEIMSFVDRWPDKWVFVVHTRYNPDKVFSAEQLEIFRRTKKVYFSSTPIPSQQYDEIIDGADAGIAFYSPMHGVPFMGKNIETLGLSSGKTAYYLRSGVPVIVNRETDLGNFVEETACGISVETGEEIGAALDIIDQKSEVFRQNAFNTFETRLNFEAGFRKVIARIENLRGNRNQ